MSQDQIKLSPMKRYIKLNSLKERLLKMLLISFWQIQAIHLYPKMLQIM